MKLKTFIIEPDKLQDYLDKYQDKIKFILGFDQAWKQFTSNKPNILLLIIDVS